jgi:hypothetical protein
MLLLQHLPSTKALARVIISQSVIPLLVPFSVVENDRLAFVQLHEIKDVWNLVESWGWLSWGWLVLMKYAQYVMLAPMGIQRMVWAMQEIQ